MRLLNVIRFPIGGIRSYLRYTYLKLPDTYSTTILTVNRPEAELLPTGMAPLAVTLKTVSEKRAFAGLSLATRSLLQQDTYDVVHSQGTTAALAADLSTRRFGVPHVVTLHETFRAEQFAGFFGEAKRQFVARALRRATAVIAVSNDARENLIAHLPLGEGAESRVTVIRNGVAVEQLLRDATETRIGVRARFDVKDDVVLLGYIGRFMPEKGFDVLLAAVQEIARDTQGPAKFRVVAVNDGAFLREYRQQISQAGLDDYFLFTGFQSSAAGILTELDAVVVPSRREACPLVAIEALVLGRPLIASDCIGLRELTAGTPSLQTLAGAPESLATAMMKMIENPQHFRRTAAAYVESARRSFDSSHAAKKLVELFEQASAARAMRQR